MGLTVVPRRLPLLMNSNSSTQGQPRHVIVSPTRAIMTTNYADIFWSLLAIAAVLAILVILTRGK